MKETKRLWWGLLLLILISPVGLILPEIFQSGPAWGEWNLREVERMLGFIPAGLKKMAGFWSAPIPDYNLENWAGKGLAHSTLGYLLSAGIGVGVILLVMLVIGKVLSRKNE